jgi:hypothetical protein
MPAEKRSITIMPINNSDEFKKMIEDREAEIFKEENLPDLFTDILHLHDYNPRHDVAATRLMDLAEKFKIERYVREFADNISENTDYRKAATHIKMARVFDNLCWGRKLDEKRMHDYEIRNAESLLKDEILSGHIERTVLYSALCLNLGLPITVKSIANGYDWHSIVLYKIANLTVEQLLLDLHSHYQHKNLNIYRLIIAVLTIDAENFLIIDPGYGYYWGDSGFILSDGYPHNPPKNWEINLYDISM